MPALWEEARDWMVSVQALDPSVAGELDELYSFALHLQNGAALCNLLNIIRPGMIKEYDDKADKQFLAFSNINCFLPGCLNIGLTPDQLFEAGDLYFAMDFERVIKCLQHVSATKEGKNTPGGYAFPKAKVAADVEGLYGNLMASVGQSVSFQQIDETVYSVYSRPDEEGSDKIYSKVDEVVKRVLPAKVNTMVSRLAAPYEDKFVPGTGAPDGDYTRKIAGAVDRNTSLQELERTETAFIRTLELINEKYHKTLASDKRMNKSDISLIFGMIPTLHEIHTQLLVNIKFELGSSSGRNVGQAFLKEVEKFRVYGQYACTLTDALERIKQLEQDKNASKALAAAHESSGEVHKLNELLTAPLLRVLRYPTLLTKVLVACPEDHRDRHAIKEALAVCGDIAIFIDQTKVNHDCMIKMLAQLKGYKGTPLTEYGAMIKTGEVLYKSFTKDKNTKSLRECTMFLLDRAVLLAELSINKRGTEYNFKQLVPLSKDMRATKAALSAATDKEKVSSLKKIKTMDKFKLAVEVQKGDDPGPFVAFAVKSIQEQIMWVSSFNRAISRLGAEPSTFRKSGRDDGGGDDASSAQNAVPGRPAGSVQSIPFPTEAPVHDPEDDQDQWYVGKVDKSKLRAMFEEVPDGTFLIRESVKRAGEYSLSLQVNGTLKHIQIVRVNQNYAIHESAAEGWETIQELVRYFKNHSLNEYFTTLDVKLEHPIRAVKVRRASSLNPPMLR